MLQKKNTKSQKFCVLTCMELFPSHLLKQLSLTSKIRAVRAPSTLLDIVGTDKLIKAYASLISLTSTLSCTSRGASHVQCYHYAKHGSNMVIYGGPLS